MNLFFAQRSQFLRSVFFIQIFTKIKKENYPRE